MDTEKARIFLSILQEGSLTAAAEKLGYTTSGISRSIASLEEETGLRLLERGRTGAHATPEAQQLIPIMRELVHQAECYHEKVEQLKGMEAGTITIGISYAGYFRVISRELKAFTDRYPGIQIRTLQATSSELLQAMQRHEADVVIMTYRNSDYHFLVLRNDPMVACVPEQYPGPAIDVYPLKSYETEPFIAPFPDMETDYRRALDRAGVRPNIQYTTTDIYAAYCMIEAGLGVSLLNRLEVEGWTGQVRLLPTAPPVELQIGILYPDESQMTVAARKFVEEIQEKQNEQKNRKKSFEDRV